MKNVLEYLEQTARRLPDKTAVADPEKSLTFSQLLEETGRIGSFLAGLTSLRQPVGLFMKKSAEAYAAMLGIVQAGCFVVYLNEDQGLLRLSRMAETAKISLILTDRPKEAEEIFCRRGKKPEETISVSEGDSRPAVRIREYAEAIASEKDDAALDRIRSLQTDTDPLYCNFTSGSTGTPKGVLVSHRSVIDFMNYFPDLFGIGEKDVIGNQAPFDFDVSVKDIYSSLKTGATLVLIPRKYFTVVTSLLDYLEEKKVSTLIWAVSALCLVVSLKGFTYKVPSSVRRVLFSGEVMPEKFLRAWMDALPQAEFVNLYGPSEITCNCTWYRVPRENFPMPLPVGLSFPNEKVFLLDEEDRLVTEPGAMGEICVSGTCLALGYLNAPELTGRVFCESPLSRGWPERMYRTGDLGAWNEEGLLCFGGRKDFQIKLFGHRIEIEEVELALNAAKGVDRGFVVFNRDKNRLEGYFSGEVTPRDLKKELLKALPSYMVPARLFGLDQIPVGKNGKIDRRAVLADMKTDEERTREEKP